MKHWPDPLKLPNDAPTSWLALSHKYHREMSEACLERLRLLHDKASVVVIEYRREFEPGELADVDALEEALQAIGEIPE
jgi:hypothetical protein